MKEGEVPRTKVPELRKTTLNLKQIDRLHQLDVWIDNLVIEKPVPLKERWQQLDRELIDKRNKEIGWKR